MLPVKLCALLTVVQIVYIATAIDCTKRFSFDPVENLNDFGMNVEEAIIKLCQTSHNFVSCVTAISLITIFLFETNALKTSSFPYSTALHSGELKIQQ